MRHKAIEIVCAHVGHSIRGVSLKTNSGNLRRDSKDIGVSRHRCDIDTRWKDPVTPAWPFLKAD